MKESPTTRQYAFHETTLAVTGTAAVQQALHARLRYFPILEQGVPDVHFDFVTLGPGQPHQLQQPAGHGRLLMPVSDDGFHLEYFAASDQLYVSYRDEVRAVCDAARSRVEVSIPAPEREHVWAATHPMFVLPLFELLKRRGYFNVHAAGLSIAGKALLIVGHSGAGKSTLALLLCRAGFEFMSDDYVFLKRGPQDLRVLAFPEELDLRHDAPHLFPELEPAFAATSRPTGVKRRIRVEDYWPTRPSWEGSPAVLVFPTVAESKTSRLEPIDAGEALTHLVSNVQYTQPQSAQAHVDALGSLVQASACYRLRTGRDFDVLPGMLRALVEHGPGD